MAGTNTNSPTPPVAPAESDLWFNTTNGREYVWYISPGTGLGSWVQTQPTSEAVVPPATHSTPPVTPPSVGPLDVTRVPTITISQVPPLVPPPIQGDQWWNTINGQLFIFYDDGNTTQWVLANRGTGEQGPPGPPGAISELAEGAGIILTPNPILGPTGVVAVDFTVVPHISDLGNYLPLTGGTITGNFLGVSHTGDVYFAVNSTDAGVGRPRVQFKKQGVLTAQISTDGVSLGALYYETFGASSLHQFFVGGVATWSVVPSGGILVGNFALSGTVAGNARSIVLQTSGSDRWHIGPGFDAEGGGNAGSTLWIGRYSDAGAFLGTPISIDRATGNVSIENTINIAGNEALVGLLQIGPAGAPDVTVGRVAASTLSFGNGANNTGGRVDFATGGTFRFKNFSGGADANVTFATRALNDNSVFGATTGYVQGQGYSGIATVTIANTMPGVGSPQVLDVAAGKGNWYWVGQYVWVQDIGFCKVYATNPNQVGIINLGHATNVAPTTVIPIGKALVPAGPIAHEWSQNLSGINYQLILEDSGRHIYHQAGSAAATYTIPANATVAFPIGAEVKFVNDSVNAVTIAITTDTLIWSPSGTAGSRTLAQFGVATALKVTATRWIITGTGLT